MTAEEEGLITEQLFDASEFGDEIAEEQSRNVFEATARSASYDTERPIRLRRVKLVRTLGFEDSTIELDDFKVLVGANNSGKSSLMRAIAFAQTLLKVHVERIEDERVTLARGRNLADSLLPVPEVRDLWFQSKWRVGNSWVLAEVELEFDSGLRLGFGLKGPFGHATSRLQTDRQISRSEYDRITNFPIVYVPSSVGVVDREEFRTPARIEALIAGGRAHEVLRNLLFALKEQGRLDEVSLIIERYFSGAIGDVSFESSTDEYIRVLYKEDSDHDLFGAGAGFVQILQLLAFMIYEQPGILMVDEPDAHLHSSLQRIVVDVLRQASQDLGLQVLLATHSKEIVNYVDPEELLVVDRKERVLAGLGEHESAISVLESLGNVDSIDAYQIITSRKMVLIEGKSDKRILASLAAKRGSSVFDGSDRLVMVETGGESTATARSDLAILEKIMEKEVQSLQLLDRDARLQGDLERAESSAPRPLHMWRRDSMESYLVAPAAIARLIASKEPDLDATEVGGRVTEVVQEVVHELRDSTLDRVSTRFRQETMQAEERNVEIVEANRKAREAIEDPEELVRLTRGKDLLAGVRKAVQDEYGVSFGNNALIAEMDEEDIDQELWEVLDRIEALSH